MGSYYDEDWHEWKWDDQFDHRDGVSDYSRTEIIAILAWKKEDTDLHLFLAPCADGRWHTWGENCFPGTHDAFDAIYDYVEGGAYFRHREAALAAAYQWLVGMTKELLNEADPALAYEI